MGTSFELENKNIAKKLDLDDRIKVAAKKEAFITLTYHKPNFNNYPTCRLNDQQSLNSVKPVNECSTE